MADVTYCFDGAVFRPVTGDSYPYDIHKVLVVRQSHGPPNQNLTIKNVRRAAKQKRVFEHGSGNQLSVLDVQQRFGGERTSQVFIPESLRADVGQGSASSGQVY